MILPRTCPVPTASGCGRALHIAGQGTGGADGHVALAHHGVDGPQPGSLEALIGLFADCDLVLLEGQKASPYPKIELVRGAVSHESVCAPETLLALATDTPARVDGVETIGLEDYARAAGILLHAMRR